MIRPSLQRASFYCLALWFAIWLLWLLLRVAPIDYRVVPGIGMILLATLALSFLAPLAAIVIAIAALIRQPRMPLNWVALGASVLAVFAHSILFFANQWM